jgi:hypothetical protein
MPTPIVFKIQAPYDKLKKAMGMFYAGKSPFQLSLSSKPDRVVLV